MQFRPGLCMQGKMIFCIYPELILSVQRSGLDHIRNVTKEGV